MPRARDVEAVKRYARKNKLRVRQRERAAPERAPRGQGRRPRGRLRREARVLPGGRRRHVPRPPRVPAGPGRTRGDRRGRARLRLAPGTAPQETAEGRERSASGLLLAVDRRTPLRLPDPVRRERPADRGHRRRRLPAGRARGVLQGHQAADAEGHAGLGAGNAEPAGALQGLRHRADARPRGPRRDRAGGRAARLPGPAPLERHERVDRGRARRRVRQAGALADLD